MAAIPWKKLASDRVVLATSVVAFLGVAYLSRDLVGQVLSLVRKAPYTHMHCRDCGEEFTYRRGMELQPCPGCESRAGLVPTAGPAAEQAGVGRLVALGVLILVLLQGLLYVGYWRLGALRLREEEARARRFSCKCPYCQRKVGYTLSRAGLSVKCPRCKTTFVLPEVAEDAAAPPS